MSGPTFLSDPYALRAAFEELCEWAEQIVVCTPRIVIGHRGSVVWPVLERNLRKVRLCLVSDRAPDLADLAPLHARAALRLVSSHGRRLHASVYLFHLGDQVRALVGSARLTGDGLGEGIEAVVRLEGSRDDAFACSLFDFMDLCLARARVPRPGDLTPVIPTTPDEPRQVESRAPVRHPELLSDAGVDKVFLVDDPGGVRELQERLWSALNQSAAPRRVRVGRKRVQGYWHADYDLWTAILETKSRFWTVLGRNDPASGVVPEVSLCFGIDKTAVVPVAETAFATDQHRRRTFLVHRGGLGVNGREGRRLFWKATRLRGVTLETDEGAERVVLVADVQSGAVVEQLAAYLVELDRIRTLGRRPTGDDSASVIIESGAKTTFTEIPDHEERAELVWLALLGQGTLTKDEAVRTAVRRLREEGRLDYHRLHATGPVYETVLAAVEHGVRLGHFDRPRRGHVRAFLERAEDYWPELWEACVLATLDQNPVTREEAVRQAALWATESLGLRHSRLRTGGRVDSGLRRALSRCVRRGDVSREGRDRVWRVNRS